ncbi:hypothetical protein MTO96_017791 [Rhipicephalus appendiculatus]
MPNQRCFTLVPFTLVPTIVIAWYKGHLFAVWNGLRLPTSPPPVTAEAAEDKPSPPKNDPDKTPNQSETEELIPEEPTDTTGRRRKKSRRRKRSRRTSESAAKSPRDSVKEVVAAEGDDAAHNAELLVAVERHIMPSPQRASPPVLHQPGSKTSPASASGRPPQFLFTGRSRSTAPRAARRSRTTWPQRPPRARSRPPKEPPAQLGREKPSWTGFGSPNEI